jgi:hypothetical protein
VARYGAPDDSTDQPPPHVDEGMGGEPPSEPPGPVDPFDQESGPREWYRNPVVLIGWALLVLILIALIVYGIVELIHGDQGTSRIPSTSTSSTTPTTTSATTTTPPSTTSTPAPPPTSSAVAPPAQQPSQQPTREPTQQPTHRHHLPPLPSVITIPEVPTVITLPPGLP